jgi:hypothetical protein
MNLKENFLAGFYKIAVPKPLRTKFLKDKIKLYLVKKLGLLGDKIDTEKKEILNYIIKNGIEIFPYEFTKNYSQDTVEVHLDKSSGLKYVLHNDNKLYFKKRWSKSRIKRSYSQLLMEQDIHSPHRYLNDSFSIKSSDIVVDFGAAEGNFSLSVVDKVKQLYLFEADKEWIVALNKTFEPWKHKVTIVQKFVSNCDDDKHCKGDTYFKDKKISFLKIDVDGAEKELLEGLKTILQNISPLKIALCTYHKNNDEADFSDLLSKNGFSHKASPGYMIFYYDKQIKAPYLRRGLLQAWK